MSVFILKIIAMVTMATDHAGFQLMDNYLPMRLIGRTAFMVYAFLMAEGYYHLKDAPDRLAKHIGKLVLLCLVTEVPFDLFEFREWSNFQTQSVLPTLLLGFLALIASGWWTDWMAGTGRIAVVNRTAGKDRTIALHQPAGVDRITAVDRTTVEKRPTGVDRTTVEDRTAEMNRTAAADRPTRVGRTTAADRQEQMEPAFGDTKADVPLQNGTEAWRRFAGLAGSAVICLSAAAAAYLIHSEYRFAGVLLVVLFYLCQEKTGNRRLPVRALALAGVYVAYLAIYIWQRSGFGGWQEFAAVARGQWIWFVGIAVSIIPLLFYNRKLGYHSKWFDALYSCFYPAQFVVIIVLRALLERA